MAKTKRVSPPTGFVIYEGPSLLTGEPIVCIATVHSGNGKTGDMVQTWIMLPEVDPITGNRIGADVAICGKCPSMGRPRPDADKGFAEGRACYVELAHAPLSIYGAYRRGSYPRVVGHAAIAAVGAGRKVRLGAYGDPAALPSYINSSLISAAAGHTAYSHQSEWQGSAFDASTMMVSADSLEAARAAWAMGARTFRVVGDLSEMVAGREAPCPATDEIRARTGKETQCVDCMLCGGAKVRAKSMVIVAHGAGAKHHEAVL